MPQPQSTRPTKDLSPEDFSEFILEETQTEEKEESSKAVLAYQKEERYIIIEKIAGQLEQNRGERVKYAKRTFILTCIWIGIVLLMVIASGLKILPGDKRVLELSEKILVVLITTTTINVFAFFILVMQFLFNKREMSTIEFLFTGKGPIQERVARRRHEGQTASGKKPGELREK